MTKSSALIILLPGLYLPGWSMGWLGHRLRLQGFHVRSFGYQTVGKSPAENALRLAECVASEKRRIVHIVAHSLGGLVLRHLCSRCPDLPLGRTVTLGTSHMGSAVAATLAARRMSRVLLGKSTVAGLLGDAPPWPADRELGVIAGNVGLGLGRLFVDFRIPHDGTVAVAETRLPQAKDHIVLQVNHFGLLASSDVARQTAHFLSNGQFLRP